jgi:N,N'-diacetyllegionaminate synthase
MVSIGGIAIGGTGPTYVAAEMAWSHDGSLDKANIIIDGAAAAGANAINFHVTHLPSYMVPFYGSGPGRVSGGRDVHDVYRYLDSINANFDMITAMFNRAKAKGLAVSCMVNDPESCNFVQNKIAADFLMVHPSSIFDEAFVRQIAQAGKPFVLYTGGLTLGEIEKAVDWARAEGNSELILQHGFQSFPTPIELNRLHFIPTLKRLFGLPVAFADHTDGEHPMAVIVPLLAVALGADMLEKHITHDRSVKGEDYEAALDPAGFATLIERLRESEAAMGNGAWHGLSEREQSYRAVARKRAVASARVQAGEVLQRSHIVYKRADAGLYPEEIVPLVDKVRLVKDVEENTPLDWRFFAPVEPKLT